MPDMSVERDKVPTEVTVELLAPNGLGFGEGGISSNREGLSPEVKQKAHEVIIDPSQILVAVDRDDDGQVLDDDGCGDGRKAGKLFNKVTDTFKRSLNRAKVFGGSPTMASAAEIGMGGADSNLLTTFKTGLSRLRSRMINFGGHTDTHAHGPNCGCGAIDKAPVIIDSTVTYAEQIGSVMTDVLGLDGELTQGTLSNFADYKASMDASDYSGRGVMDEVVEAGAFVKELEDDHREWAIVLNFVEGKTVNQAAVRDATDGDAQVFAVDVWRLRSIAERSYDSEEEQNKAFASMLVYTLGTAAVLTKGDLPVYVVKESAVPATPEDSLAA